MTKNTFKHKRLLPDALEPFGFVRQGEEYRYQTTLLDGQFLMTVTVHTDGVLQTELTDTATDEEYVLHLVPEAAGAFVGKVREAYDGVLSEISNACYAPHIFQNELVYRLFDYVRDAYQSEPEHLWEKFPENAVLRRSDNKKWYAAILTTKGERFGLASHPTAEVVNLQIPPEKRDALLEKDGYFPAYHMNKTHWISILLDGTAPFDDIRRLVDESYRLASRKHKKEKKDDTSSK